MHLNLGWVVVVSPKIDVLVSAGPSFFRLQQDVVTSVIITEAGDFATPVIATEVEEVKRSVMGFNVGADATYVLWQNDNVRVGAGGFVRVASATTDVRMLATDVETKVGGVQFGFGGRIRF